MYRIKAVSLVLFLLVAPCVAQLPGVNAFVGYSYMSADLAPTRTNLNGWNGSVEGKVLPFIGLVADLSGYYGSPTFPAVVCPTGLLLTCSPLTANVREYNFLFGPRFSFSIRKFRPFAHGLLGAGHISESFVGFSPSDTKFAYAVGGGIDYHLIPRISWRVQADDLRTRFFGNTQNNFRLSTGIVVHF